MVYANSTPHPVLPTFSSTAGEQPTTGSLRDGEIAVNSSDGTVFVGGPAGEVHSIPSSPTFPSADGVLAAALIPTSGTAIINGLSGTFYGSDSTTPGGQHSDEQRVRDGIHWAQSFYSTGVMKTGQDAVDDWNNGVLYAYKPSNQSLVSYNRGEACFLLRTLGASKTLSMTSTTALTGGTVEFNYDDGAGWTTNNSKTYTTAGYYMVKVRWTGGSGGGILQIGDAFTTGGSGHLTDYHILAVFSTGGKASLLLVGAGVNLSGCCVFHTLPVGGTSNSSYVDMYQDAPFVKPPTNVAVTAKRRFLLGRVHRPERAGRKSICASTSSSARTQILTENVVETSEVGNYYNHYEQFKASRLKFYPACDFDSMLAFDSIDGGSVVSGTYFECDTFLGFSRLRDVPPNLAKAIALGVNIYRFQALVTEQFLSSLYAHARAAGVTLRPDSICVDGLSGSGEVVFDIGQNEPPPRVFATSEKFSGSYLFKRTYSAAKNLVCVFVNSLPFSEGGPSAQVHSEITIPGASPSAPGIIYVGDLSGNGSRGNARVSLINEAGERLQSQNVWNGGLYSNSFTLDFDAYGEHSPVNFLLPNGSSFAGPNLHGNITGDLYGKIHLAPNATSYADLFGSNAGSTGVTSTASYDSFLAWMRHLAESGYFTGGPLTIGAITATYSAAGALDRAVLVAGYGWTITDGGQV